MTKLMFTTRKEEMKGFVTYGNAETNNGSKLKLNEGVTNNPWGKELVESMDDNEPIPNEHLGDIIAYECEKRSRGAKDPSDLNSYLLERTFVYITENEGYQTITGIRQRTNSFALNYYKKELNERCDDITISEGSRIMLTDSIEYNLEIQDALNKMTPRQRKIAELQVGIFDSLTTLEMDKVSILLDEKARCGCGSDNCTCTFEVYLTLQDISDVLECSVRTIKNEKVALVQKRD